MTEHQRLFLVQARTDIAVFKTLRSGADFPACHALHYLQMATEMLGKAHLWRRGWPGKKTHGGFVSFLKALAGSPQARKHLGYEGQNENWKHVIRKSLPLAERVEKLAPSFSSNKPNPEYPWPEESPEHAPAEHDFEIWRDLEQTSAGRHFLDIVHRLFAVAEAYL